MDNIITGLIGVGIFLLFVGGLGQTIGELPFILIVIFVSGMAIYGLYEDFRGDQHSNE